MLKFYMIFARKKLTKFPHFTGHLPKMCPNFTLLCPKNTFPGFFLGGGGGNPLPGAGPQASHQLNLALLYVYGVRGLKMVEFCIT